VCCPCAIRIRSIRLPYGFFFTTQGLESRSCLPMQATTTCAIHSNTRPRQTKQPLSTDSIMQSPASTASSPARYVVCPSAALAALMFPEDAEGAEPPELSEDELLVVLRQAGLITYPSPLLGPLLALPAVFEAEVLPRLEPAGRALVARVGRASRAVVVASGLPRAGTTGGVPLKIKDFIGTVELLAWAKENGCPWVARTCAMIALHGHLEVLRRARELECPWDASTCAAAAGGGHLAVMVWARQHGCPWEENIDDGSNAGCCALAAAGGHLEVLKWLREHGCPWVESTCAAAAAAGQLEVLKWAREHGCPWEENIDDHPGLDCCSLAACGGHLEVLKWLRTHHCPWNEETCALAARGGHLSVLKWVRAHHCPWTADNSVRGPLGAFTWRCCSGRGSTGARGLRISRRRTGTWTVVGAPLGAVTWRC